MCVIQTMFLIINSCFGKCFNAFRALQIETKPEQLVKSAQIV